MILVSSRLLRIQHMIVISQRRLANRLASVEATCVTTTQRELWQWSFNSVSWWRSWWLWWWWWWWWWWRRRRRYTVLLKWFSVAIPRFKIHVQIHLSILASLSSCSRCLRKRVQFFWLTVYYTLQRLHWPAAATSPEPCYTTHLAPSVYCRLHARNYVCVVSYCTVCVLCDGLSVR